MIKNIQKGFSNRLIVALVISTLALALATSLGAQYFIEQDRTKAGQTALTPKDSYEISKLDAEIRQIRSDTAGSLFALKLIALFVTVGGAVGGYLIAQSSTTKARLEFEDRKNVDEVYQSIIRELADESAILRAAAAVKLGSILKSFPSEWNVSDARKDQLKELTKQVLAAAMSIEEDEKVLKTLSINLILYKKMPDESFAHLREIDLSGAKAIDAYWARCDFSFADFYAANLSQASFRKSLLNNSQFRQAQAQNTVFDGADCSQANFLLADLRGASFAGATLDGTNFQDAHVASVTLTGATIRNLPDCMVDLSANGDGSQPVPIREWLLQAADPEL
jgi:hypothetical protein